MGRIILAVVIAYCAFVAYIYWAQRDFMYFPFGDDMPPPKAFPAYSEIHVETKDGLRLTGWYAAPDKSVGWVIVMFHGNAQNISVRPPKMADFLEQGYGILLAEYRGYGGNPGQPTEKGLYADGRAYLDWLIREKKYKAEDIILFGESLGSAVAVQLGTEYEVKAVILDVPFNNAVALARRNFFFVPFLSILMKDQYRSDEKIGRLSMPVIIGVGGRDYIAPPRFGRALYRAATEPKILKEYPGAGHFDLASYGFHQDIMTILEDLSDQTSGQEEPDQPRDQSAIR